MEEVIIRRARIEEYDEAIELVYKVFLRFEAAEYGKEGTDSFAEFLTSNDLYNLFATGHYVMYVAEYNKSIVGVASVRSGNHISLLFVDEKYHHRGIGRRLLLALGEYVSDTTDYNTLTVNSSPYAVDFYHRIGFEDTGEQRRDSGIIFTPMELSLI